LRIRGYVVAALVLLGGACGEEEPEVMDRGVFIAVMIELRQAELETDEATFAARREEILLGAGVTDSMLVEFARVRGTDATFMAAVWDSIDRVVNVEAEAGPELAPDTAVSR
jgi:hypothetical protein